MKRNCYAGHASPFSLLCHMYMHTQEYFCLNYQSGRLYSLSDVKCNPWNYNSYSASQGIPCILCKSHIHYFAWKSANSRACVSLHNMLALQWKAVSSLPISKAEGTPPTGFPQLAAYICSYVGLPWWHDDLLSYSNPLQGLDSSRMVGQVNPCWANLISCRKNRDMWLQLHTVCHYH